MRVERSRTKIVISKNDYERLEAAKAVIEEMREELYNADEDELNFYSTLNRIEDDLEELTYGFESTRHDEYYAEVD